MKTKSLFAVGMLVLLSACTYVDIDGNDVPADIVDESGDAAFLVGRISFKITGDEKSPNTHHYVLFKRKNSEQLGYIIVSRRSMYSYNDYREEDRVGNVFAIPLKPGEYELANVQLYFNDGVFERTISSKQEYSVAFTLEAGKAHYLGEFVAHGKYGKSIFGKTIPVGGYFVYSDNLERDQEVILKKYPHLADRPMVSLGLNLNFPPLLVPEGSNDPKVTSSGDRSSGDSILNSARAVD